MVEILNVVCIFSVVSSVRTPDPYIYYALFLSIELSLRDAM